MDPMVEEQLDYGEDDYGGSQKLQLQGSGGAIPALAEEDDDEFDDLYNDVNVGQGFMTHHTLQQQPEPPPVRPFGNGGLLKHKIDGPAMAGSQHNASIPGVGVEGNGSRPRTEQNPSGFLPAKGLEEGTGDYPEGVSQKGNSRVLDMAQETSHVGDVGFRGGSAAPMPPKIGTLPLLSDSGSSAIRGGFPVPPNPAAGLVGSRPMVNEDSRLAVGSVENNGQTMLFVGDLQWWTTDAELESMLSEYGRVKEIKFFDERASGKSKGYCQVEFYDPAAAAACKEGMSGHVFNGRACVVAFASAQAQRQMGAAYLNRTQTQAQSQPQGRRVMNDGMGRGGGGGMNYQGGDGGRNYGRGGWGGRGGQGLLNRGQGGGGGAMRGRGFIGTKGMMGSGGGVGTGGPYGQGLAGPGALGGLTVGLMHPQSMMGAGFDPSTYMGRGGPYGGFSAPAFPGMIPSFQAVNAIGLPGVAPHVNPAFFGRGMSVNGMGIMGSSGMEGHSGGMWADASMGGWTGEEHGRKTRESSYGGDDVGSEYGYGEVNHERGGRSNASRERERGSERDWSGNSERRHRDEKEQDWDRSDKERHREEKDGYGDHRPRDRDWDNEDDWDRGQSSSRSRIKSYMTHEDDHRSRTRDADYGKRRRLPSE